MTDSGRPTAAILIIGNEILSGRTQDVNLNYLAKRLTALGIRPAEARVIPDEPDVIIDAVNHCRRRFTYVFTTGGIGPTHDDITSECVARAFGLPIERNADALARLMAMYEKRNMEVTEARLKMADMPVGAHLIDNAISAAPGFRVENVHVLAGIPSVMQSMFETVAESLQGGPVVNSRTVTAYVGEGVVAKPLGDLQVKYPALEIGSYPFYRRDRYGTNLVLRGDDPGVLNAAVDELVAIVDRLGGAPEIDNEEAAAG